MHIKAKHDNSPAVMYSCRTPREPTATDSSLAIALYLLRYNCYIFIRAFLPQLSTVASRLVYLNGTDCILFTIGNCFLHKNWWGIFPDSAMHKMHVLQCHFTSGVRKKCRGQTFAWRTQHDIF